MLNTCLPSGSPESWDMPGSGCLCELPPIKVLLLGLQELPWQTRLHTCPWTLLLEEQRDLHDTHWDRTTGSWCLVSFWLHPMRIFLCWFCFVSFFFSVINLEHAYKLSRGIPVKYWTWRWSWRPGRTELLTSYKSIQMPFHLSVSVAEGEKKHKNQTWMSRMRLNSGWW